MTANGPHNGDTCAEVEQECEDLRGEINAVLWLLEQRGFTVDKDQSLLRNVRPALLRRAETTMSDRPLVLIRPDHKAVAVLDTPQFEECYHLVGVGEPIDGHPWARPSELADWIPLAPAQNGARAG